MSVVTAPLDWSKVKPSTSPPLLQVEIDALPTGMVILKHFPYAGWTAAVVGTLRDSVGSAMARPWQGAWSPTHWPLRSPDVVLPRLPRLSFALTADAVRERRKTVTRRLSLPSWWKEGAWFLGVDKIRQAGAQGLCVAQCGMATREPLVSISEEDVVREGFDTTPGGFCAMFRSTTPRDWDGWVWRLPFTYMEIPA